MPPVRPDPRARPLNPICTPRGEDWPVCVARIEISEQVDWQSLLMDIVAARACSMTLTPLPNSIMHDAGDLDVRLSVAGNVETYWCNAPGGSARAGAREAVRVMDVLGKLVQNAGSR